MKRIKLPLISLYLGLACFIPVIIMFFMAYNMQAGSTIGWFSLMECITPIVIFGLALIIYFTHKARIA